MTTLALATLAQATTPAWVQTLTAAAQVVLAISILLLAGAVVGLVIAVRRARQKVEPLLTKLRGDFDPVVRNAVAASENVSYITSAVRGDVERLSDTVTRSTQRLDRLAATAERRVGDFNALLGVVQQEAEELFIGGASAARGLRAGRETLRASRETLEDELEDELDEEMEAEARHADDDRR